MCGAVEEEALKPRSHAFARWRVVQAPTCTASGLRERPCRHCAFIHREVLRLRAHAAGRWQTAVPARLFTPGQQVKPCRNCGQALLSRSYYPGDKAFAVSFCAMGARFRDAWPGLTTSWYRFALLDLSRDGVVERKLIAADAYWVGNLYAHVEQGRVWVSYTLFGARSKVFKERMQLIAPGTPITEDLLSSNRQGRKLSTPGAIVRHDGKGEQTLLLYLRLDGVFDRLDPANVRLDWSSAVWQQSGLDNQAELQRARPLFHAAQ